MESVWGGLILRVMSSFQLKSDVVGRLCIEGTQSEAALRYGILKAVCAIVQTQHFGDFNDQS
jgi:hypothetical protein